MKRETVKNMDALFMQLALKEARLAAKEGEAPIGAVLVRNADKCKMDDVIFCEHKCETGCEIDVGNIEKPQTGREKNAFYGGECIDLANGARFCLPKDVEIHLARNHREFFHDVTSHAEIESIRAAGKAKGDWRLPEYTLYVTLEPCPMCAGAILGARISRVVYGAKDATAGAMGSVLDLPRYPLGVRPTVTGGVLATEAAALLREFFQEKRKNEKF